MIEITLVLTISAMLLIATLYSVDLVKDSKIRELYLGLVHMDDILSNFVNTYKEFPGYMKHGLKYWDQETQNEKCLYYNKSKANLTIQYGFAFHEASCSSGDKSCNKAGHPSISRKTDAHIPITAAMCHMNLFMEMPSHYEQVISVASEKTDGMLSGLKISNNIYITLIDINGQTQPSAAPEKWPPVLVALANNNLMSGTSDNLPISTIIKMDKKFDTGKPGTGEMCISSAAITDFCTTQLGTKGLCTSDSEYIESDKNNYTLLFKKYDTEKFTAY